MINLPNIDGKIWNLEYHIIDICHTMSAGKKLDIHLNQEGPDALQLGLYDLLDKLCERFKYPKKHVSITTCNQVEQHPEYVIKKCPPLYIDSAQEFVQRHQFPIKTFDQDFKHFGLFVGRSNWLRLWLGSLVHSHYRDQAVMTFHYNARSDFHRDHLGFDDLCRKNSSLVTELDVISLLKCCPIMNERVESYPILTPAHFNISKLYHTFFLEIVCETYCQGRTFYPTEKTWRPIINRTPFIVQGPRDFLTNLRRIGFRTFNQWFDEGHDEDDYTCQIPSISKVIERLSTLPVSDLEGMYIDMQETLDHNYHVMMDLTKQKVLDVFA